MSADPHPTIALLQNHSLTMVVQQEIERAILSGEFAPGAKLNEAALALRLGVSRGPVREAFRMLDEAGLVRTEKNRGVFVRDIPIDEAIEIYELRAAMEESVGRRLAERMDPAQREEAHGLVRAMESAVQAQDAHTYHRLNLQFHDRLVEMAGNRKLTSIYRKLVKEISLFRRLNLDDARQLPASAQAHWDLLQAIDSRDPDIAGRALFDHAIQSKNRMLDMDAGRRPEPAPRP
ncbi:MAG: phosphonate utilization associated transcriptional regulator [Rhodoferax sp.]|jgi:phosphonate utilization transcriptional regulator|nr:phosphonate utilization associated transcriptional regulator [Rhodoferax sp.]